jgi:hypothetical protein
MLLGSGYRTMLTKFIDGLGLSATLRSSLRLY